MLHAPRDVAGRLHVLDVLEQDHELIAAEPDERIARAQTALQAPSDLDEHEIADNVPQAIVDGLEAIQIQEQDRPEMRAGVLLCNEFVKAIQREGAV